LTAQKPFPQNDTNYKKPSHSDHPFEPVEGSAAMEPTCPHHLPLGQRLTPFWCWLKTYRPADFKNDAIAGVTVAVVLIPQAVAYAMLAGLPPVYGLYAAAVTPAIAAMWGSLRQLSTGPIAIMSLLVLTSLSLVAAPGTPAFIEAALVLSFMIGLLYVALGLLRMGIVMAFISHSAVKGFTSAAALIITATQLPHLLGLQTGFHEYILHMLLDILKKLGTLHWQTALLGLAAAAVIKGIKIWRPQWPGGLIALALTTAAVRFWGLDRQGVAIVGVTAGGLPAFGLPGFDFDLMSRLFGPAVVVALVSFAETYSVGKTVAAQTRQKVDVDQEFIGQGLANLIGSFWQCYPVSGSFSRTAINLSAGARTAISSVTASACVILVLVFFTPLLTYVPKAALAALVISAVMTLFHPRQVLALWRMNRHDGIVAIAVFLLSLLTKPDYALLIGVMIALMFFLWKTMHPRIVRVTKDPQRNMFVNADLDEKPGCPQILHLRSDNAIYFANAEYTADHILERIERLNTPVLFLLLDLQAAGFIDITGIDELRGLVDNLRRRGTCLAIMGVHRPVREVMASTGFLDALPAGHLIDNPGQAIGFLFQRLDHRYCKDVCPHSLFHECPTVK
jgi:SulP family sulfate permease